MSRCKSCCWKICLLITLAAVLYFSVHELGCRNSSENLSSWTTLSEVFSISLGDWALVSNFLLSTIQGKVWGAVSPSPQCYKGKVTKWQRSSFFWLKGYQIDISKCSGLWISSSIFSNCPWKGKRWGSGGGGSLGRCTWEFKVQLEYDKYCAQSLSYKDDTVPTFKNSRKTKSLV